MLIEYAGMNAGVIAAWVVIATAAGWTARTIVRGKKLLGLWGDMAIGLVGIYLMALLFGALQVDLDARLESFLPQGSTGFARWLDILVSALIGTLAIRTVIRPFTGGGGGGH